MSDEPKKRSRAWLGWSVLLLLIAYPLSMGPVLKYGKVHSVLAAYDPLERFCESWQPLWEVKERYNSLWGVHVTRHPITGLHEVRQWEP
jgi:hypothetical protein